jgi:hypothetical protein
MLLTYISNINFSQQIFLKGDQVQSITSQEYDKIEKTDKKHLHVEKNGIEKDKMIQSNK